MMLYLSRRTVRQAWSSYVGALVAITLGVTLLATAVRLAGAVETTAGRAGTSRADRIALSDLSTLFGMTATIAEFMALFVVASSFGLVVASRRRALGLIRLVGATPRQVRRMVLGESVIVAAIGALLGCTLAGVAEPALAELLELRRITPVHLVMPSPWLSWAVAAPSGVVVAVGGAWRASKRAARVAPTAALRESVLERRRPSFVQALVGTLCLAGPGTVFVLADRLDPLFAMVASILIPEVLVVGLMCFAGWLYPLLAGGLARPFIRRHVAARLARDQVRAAPRSAAAVGSPVLAISAIAGSLILALALIADWTAALDREHLRVPQVVETHGDRSVVDRLIAAHLPVVDQRRTAHVTLGADAEAADVDVVDLHAAVAARGLHASSGDLEGLAEGGVAVTETYATDQGVGVGDRLPLRVGGHQVHPQVAAVVSDAPDLYADVLLTRSLVPRPGAPELVFVDPGRRDLTALLAGTHARVLTSAAWIDETDRSTRAANEVGLWVLLGPSALYAGIAIVNAIMMGISQRRRQLRTLGLLGATEQQLRRVVSWEAGLIAGGALFAGSVIACAVGWMVRHAISRDVADAGVTIPWTPLGAVAGLCLALALLAGWVGARTLRR